MSEETAATELAAAAGRPVLEEAAMEGRTTIGCGGPVDFLVEAVNTERLQAILQTAGRRRLPWIILGQGSNLLVADQGWRGLAITLAGELDGYDFQGNEMHAGGGLLLPRAARLAAERGLSGLEPLAGIPGTIGGAVAMNAGAFGAAIGDLVLQVEICGPEYCSRLERDELDFRYRNGNLPPETVVSRAVLALKPGDAAGIQAAVQDFRSRREGSQPRGRTCGSVFKNPSGGASAGELLDRAGCKGMSQGGAEVSRLHANFIVNKRQARTADVLGLMNRCRRQVYESFGVELEPEVRFLGDIGMGPLK